MAYDFDLFVIGGGSGGISSARRAATHGAKVALAERDRLGGTCANRGCVPKKLMVYASHFPKYAKESAGYGWQTTPGIFDWQAMLTAVNNEVRRLNAVYQRLVEESKVKIFRENAKIIDAHTVALGAEKVTAERILIAVGGKPVTPNIPGIEYALASNAMFELSEQPKRMVILGGGYVGCEFACIMNGLGTEVTVVIRREKVLNGFDQDLRNELHGAMEKQGIRIINNAEMTLVEKTQKGVSVTLNDGREKVILTDVVNLAATGRQPMLSGLGLENTAVETEKGAIATNQYSQTAEPSIYAIGDCTDRINLTPVAIDEGRALADTLYGKRSRHTSYDCVPSAVFTTPEAATVGLTEAQAIEAHGKDNIRVFRSRFCSMYYSLTDKTQKTFMKLIVHAKSNKVLGAHMVGDHAAEIIQGIAIALKMGATKADFDATIGIHPSAAEEFVTMRSAE
ncbi:MAG: glutathione-disulfide reductase [Cyanobacteria bacterium J06627_28]